MKETIEVFQKKLPVSDSHPQCLFPSRYLFLKKHFNLEAEIRCEKFSQWTEHYRPEKLLLVYASQYLSNPASVFGHSFLLLPSPKQTKGFWLSFNYAASIPVNTSGVGYIYGGLTGGFQGDYSTLPYYQRLFQYGSVENRELWHYEVLLSSEELTFFLAHLWELVHAADFTYYFLDENCAGILLRTFAAILPDMEDQSALPVYVHPIEVIHRLDQKGRLGKVDLVPSQGNILRASLDRLSSDEKQTVHRVIKNPPQSHIELNQKASEALIHYTAYKSHQNQGVLPEELKSLERTAHIERSRFSTPPFEFPKESLLSSAPHLAHYSKMAEVGGSYLNQSLALDFGFRFAIHDLLDPDAGFIKNSAVEGGRLKLSATENSLWLQEFTIAHIDNYQPLYKFDPKASWRIKASFKENLLTESKSDLFFDLHSAYGMSVEVFNQYFYAHLASDLNLGEHLEQATFELGPELGAIFQFGDTKGYIAAQMGLGPFENSDTEFVKLRSGLSHRLNKRLNLTAQTQWVELPQKNFNGYRNSIAVRYYF